MTYRPKARFTPAELEEHIAKRIIAMMKADGLNWIKGWIGTSASRNLFTDREYRGSNMLTTMFWLTDNEVDDPRFATRHQIATAGGRIRKGEKGIPIFYYGTGEKTVAEDGNETTSPRYRFAKIFYVWNVTQVDWGDKANSIVGNIADITETVFSHDVADDFCENLGIETRMHGNFQPMYMPSQDEVRLPPRSAFVNTPQATALENFYATWLHELVHATGHKKRLNRESLYHYREQRPFEELVAELGSAMLCRDLGISPEPRADNAGYIAGWCKSIEDKPATILKAASAASKAVDWMWKQRNGEHEDESQDHEQAVADA